MGKPRQNTRCRYDTVRMQPGPPTTKMERHVCRCGFGCRFPTDTADGPLADAHARMHAHGLSYGCMRDSRRHLGTAEQQQFLGLERRVGGLALGGEGSSSSAVLDSDNGTCRPS